MTANEIAQAANGSDFYHNSQLTTAEAMVAEGRGGWEYVTQWKSGTCVYKSPDGSETEALTLLDAQSILDRQPQPQEEEDSDVDADTDIEDFELDDSEESDENSEEEDDEDGWEDE